MRRGVSMGGMGIVTTLFVVWILGRAFGMGGTFNPVYWAVKGANAVDPVFGDDEPEIASYPVHAAVPHMQIGDPVLGLIKGTRPPVCERATPTGRQLVWPYEAGPRDGCEPRAEDLVVVVDASNRIREIVPLWGRSEPATSVPEWTLARARYERR